MGKPLGEIHRARDEYERGVKAGKITESAMIDWRFWFDEAASVWCIERRDGAGGVVLCKELSTDVCAESEGKTMVAKGELIVNGMTNLGGGTKVEVDSAYLRTLRVFDQSIALPVVGPLRSKNIAPTI